MGAFSWSRDKAGNGGKTHVAGAPVVLPNPAAHTPASRPAKKPRVWKREEGVPIDTQATTLGPGAQPFPGRKQSAPNLGTLKSSDAQRPSTEQAAAAAVAGGGSTWQQPHAGSTPKCSSSTHTVHAAQHKAQTRHAQGEEGHELDPEALRKQEQELEALRQKIAAKQARVQQQAAGATKAAELAGRERQKQQRRERLEAGFAKAFAEAKQAAAAEIASSRTPPSFATEGEVLRVLGCRSDYEVLQLQPGADAAAVRRRYREMAVALHPDKCRAEHATDAFQRLVHAYQNLLRFAR